MKREIVFILEPDAGRVTVESSQVAASVVKEMTLDLGQGSNVNCARPQMLSEENEKGPIRRFSGEEPEAAGDWIYLYRIYHYSTVDGPGRRSVVQVAGCSIRCPNCYIPETHLRANGRLTSIDEIISELDEKSGEHDGVTILGGEPFDQAGSLKSLVARLKAKNYHLTVYSGYTLEDLLARNDPDVASILANTDLLIDGAFKHELARGAGEYRGSSNQRLIYHPISRVK